MNYGINNYEVMPMCGMYGNMEEMMMATCPMYNQMTMLSMMEQDNQDYDYEQYGMRNNENEEEICDCENECDCEQDQECLEEETENKECRNYEDDNRRLKINPRIVNRILRKIQRNNPRIFRTMAYYGVPYYVTERLVRRIIRLTLRYY